MQMNRIEIAGHIGGDPEMRLLASGTKVVNIRLGESHRYKGSNNQDVKQTNWHSLTFYNSLADLAMTYRKGVNIFVEGTLQQRKFTPKDGTQRTVHEVIVHSCHVIGNASATSSSGSNAEIPSSTNGAEEHDEELDNWPV